jgi:hypothetical protein
MEQKSDVDAFLQSIMKIKVTRMGGASPGFFGQVGTDGDLVNSLKRSAIAFATEYRKPGSNKNEVLRLSNEVEGFLHSLILTNTLSENEVDELLDKLYSLSDT